MGDTGGRSAITARTRLPDWLVIGAAKSGTTTVHQMLGRHPDVWAYPEKEANFWTNEPSPERLAWYGELFATAPAWVRAGESSPEYLFNPVAPDGLARCFGDQPPRLVAVLRNPVDRAYSQYWHAVRARPETAPTFEAALLDEARNAVRFAAPNLALAERGRYLRQLQRFERRFGREPLLVLLADDLWDDPAGTLDRIATHIGVRPLGDGWGPLVSANRAQRSVAPRRIRRATAWRANVAWRQRLSHRTLRSFDPPPMHPLTRAALVERFRPENAALARWLGRDLSGWDR